MFRDKIFCTRYQLLTVIALLCTGMAQSQVLRGTVSGTNSQLPGATISFKQSGTTAASNVSGDFSITAPGMGKQTLVISYVGFETRELEIEVKQGLNELGMVSLQPAYGKMGDVVVRGTLAPSQARAYSIKKNSLAIMDVMAADAIGKLPDRNAAEAVQRMQGVAVARYHGEADQATVRGTPFSWTSTLFNGSRLPSANAMGTRASVLDVVPSEMIQYVQVAKAITPDMEGDAIGGSINFITRTAPLKRQLNISAAGGYNNFSKDGTYNASFVYGDRFFNGKLGVMVAAAIWDRNWGTDSYEVSYNTSLPDPVAQKSINTVMFKRYMGKRQTYGTNLGLEWKFNERHKIFGRGLLDKFNDIRPVYESYVDYTRKGYQYNYRYSFYETTLNGGELGGEHQLSARLKMDWSASLYNSRFYIHTPNTLPADQKGLPIATFRQRVNSGFNGLASDGRKYWYFDSPDGTGDDPMHFNSGVADPGEVMDPAKLTLQQLVVARLDNSEKDKTVQLNLKYNVNQRFNIKVGGKFRHKDRDGINFASLVWMPAAALGIQNAPPLVSMSQLDRTGFPKPSNFFSYYPGDQSQYIINPLTKQQLFDLYDTAFQRNNGFLNVSPASNATLYYSGYEDVLGAYAMGDWDATDKLKLIAGFRNEYTHLVLNSSKMVTEVVNGAPQTTITPTQASNNYNALLPMLHLKYAVNKQANIRAAYTRTLVRPNFTDLIPNASENLTTNPFTITSGNLDLKPTFANNYDLMGEYFFKNIGLLSGGIFYKDITNVIFSNRYQQEINGNTYLITKPDNLQSASLLGFEAGISKRFDFLKGFWSGFGAEFNYSYIRSEVEVPRTVGGKIEMDKTSLPNQSKNLFNAILFYERNGVMVRFAGNYRGKSVESINQQLGPDFYTWTADNFTLDASATVNIGKSVRVFVELNNLTNEPLKTYMGDERRVTMQEWYSQRGQAGIRWDIIK